MGTLAPPPGPPQGKPEEKKGTISLFGGSKPKTTTPPQVPEVNKEISGISRRLRMLEERYENMKKKVQLVENNMLDTSKKINADVRTSTSDIVNMKEDIKDMESKLMLMIKEINLLAKKEEVDVIKKYMEFWQPLKFVTPTQVEKIVREILEEERQNL